MTEETLQMLAMGSVCIVLGLCAWLLPDSWNILRPRFFLRAIFPDAVNRIFPKIIGTLLILLGFLILLGVVLQGIS
jgi:hypothetical protein